MKYGFSAFAVSRILGELARQRQGRISQPRGLPSIFDLGYYDCLDQLKRGWNWSIAALGTKSIIPLLHHSSTPAFIEEIIYGLF